MFKTKLTWLLFALVFTQVIYSQSEITTEKLIVTNGASTDFILKTDANGNASWVDPATMFTGGTSNWALNGSSLYNLNTGNVGIGLTNPSALLHVNGLLRTGIIQTNDTKIDINRLGSGNRNALVDFYANDVATAQSARIARGAGENGHFSMQNEGSGDIFFRNGGANRVFIKSNGFVGIGTAAPTEMLHVTGDITSNALQTGLIQTNSTRVEINQLGTGTGVNNDRNAILDFHGSDVESDFSARLFRLAGEDGAFRIEQRGLGNMIFRTQNTNRAIIQPDGKFIIGAQTTPTPGTYNLYVENGILTERVKIATIGTADWADYVFEEDYKLHTLEEVKTFVQEHKHLPNVPSAKDVHEQGYELQLMDAKLLEKIEELYLLTIGLNEEKNELKEENIHLRESLKATNKQHQKTIENILERIKQLEKSK